MKLAPEMVAGGDRTRSLGGDSLLHGSRSRRSVLTRMQRRVFRPRCGSMGNSVDKAQRTRRAHIVRARALEEARLVPVAGLGGELSALRKPGYVGRGVQAAATQDFHHRGRRGSLAVVWHRVASSRRARAVQPRRFRSAQVHSSGVCCGLCGGCRRRSTEDALGVGGAHIDASVARAFAPCLGCLGLAEPRTHLRVPRRSAVRSACLCLDCGLARLNSARTKHQPHP